MYITLFLFLLCVISLHVPTVDVSAHLRDILMFESAHVSKQEFDHRFLEYCILPHKYVRTNKRDHHATVHKGLVYISKTLLIPIARDSLFMRTGPSIICPPVPGCYFIIVCHVFVRVRYTSYLRATCTVIITQYHIAASVPMYGIISLYYSTLSQLLHDKELPNTWLTQYIYDASLPHNFLLFRKEILMREECQGTSLMPDLVPRSTVSESHHHPGVDLHHDNDTQIQMEIGYGDLRGVFTTTRPKLGTGTLNDIMASESVNNDHIEFRRQAYYVVYCCSKLYVNMVISGPSLRGDRACSVMVTVTHIPMFTIRGLRLSTPVLMFLIILHDYCYGIIPWVSCMFKRSSFENQFFLYNGYCVAQARCGYMNGGSPSVDIFYIITHGQINIRSCMHIMSLRYIFDMLLLRILVFFRSIVNMVGTSHGTSLMLILVPYRDTLRTLLWTHTRMLQYSSFQTSNVQHHGGNMGTEGSRYGTESLHDSPLLKDFTIECDIGIRIYVHIIQPHMRSWLIPSTGSVSETLCETDFLLCTNDEYGCVTFKPLSVTEYRYKVNYYLYSAAKICNFTQNMQPSYKKTFCDRYEYHHTDHFSVEFLDVMLCRYLPFYECDIRMYELTVGNRITLHPMSYVFLVLSYKYVTLVVYNLLSYENINVCIDLWYDMGIFYNTRWKKVLKR